MVERIINKIVNEKIDIDTLLVVTFTNAAASEMRQRILEAIYKYLEEHPGDAHMQRQTVLMAKSNICTIHSFCLEVIKNNFFEIDISPNFRIGNQTEIEILKQEVLEEMFEEAYLEEDKEFLKLVNMYTSYKQDEPLKELILKIYRYIQASPFPEEWLEEKIEQFNLDNELDKDFLNSIWGKILMTEFKEAVNSYKLELISIKKELDKFQELSKYSLTIESDIEKMEELQSNLDSWDKAYILANSIKWSTWPRDSKLVSETKDIAKEKRDNVKKKFKNIKDKTLICLSKKAYEDINEMYEVMCYIKNQILKFSDKYKKAKQEKNMIDFNDIEHFALQILVKKENGNYIPTQIAKTYKEKFCEIAIDEYQDSNLVQEYILSTVSKGNNIFMVGDVKQSIYKFRQARPELFIEKYDTYKIKENKTKNDNLKIQLFKNFRSRKNILDVTNLIFENIMSRELGDITYNEQEYLNLGANFEENEKTSNYAGKTEINIIDLKEYDKKNDEDEEDDEEESIEHIENMQIEAKFVANRVQELIKSNYQVWDKKIGYRNVTYKDIVILLRATSILAPIYEKELSDLGIPVFSDTGTEFLETVEIETLMSVLKIIDNPLQDIPLVCVLRSPIGGFNDNDLIKIKLESNKGSNNSFYEALIQTSKNEELDIHKRIVEFLNKLQDWRKKQEYLSLDELIWQIYLDTGYYNYVSLMPNGALRQANLKILFEKAKEYEKSSFKGLFNFINFMDKLKTSNHDMDSAKLIGENENVVRIMSIHKSKGLEFPVVILSGTGKKFNMKDLNDSILLHQDIGIGPKYIDYERRIEYNTLAKLAIASKIKIETISEEMRILYVALTRAKEKLIITGFSKDFEKDWKTKQELLQMHKGDKIHPYILKKYKSYLDWMELVYIKNEDSIKEIIELKTFTKDELYEKWKKVEEKETLVKDIKKKLPKKENIQIKELLKWEYPNIVASQIPAKTSVTKIKKMQDQVTVLDYNKEDLKEPEFLKGEHSITKAEIGTLMHLCIQNLDEMQQYSYDKIVNTINKWVQSGLITKEEEKNININKLLAYTNSPLFLALKKAKEIYKEQPFYIQIPAKEVYGIDVDNKILVQGVIDLYYIDEKDNVVLVDYKTDYVKKGEEELIDKYKKQLEIYKKAIEEAIGKKVDKVYIYSTYLEKSIEIEI